MYIYAHDLHFQDENRIRHDAAANRAVSASNSDEDVKRARSARPAAVYGTPNSIKSLVAGLIIRFLNGSSLARYAGERSTFYPSSRLRADFVSASSSSKPYDA